MMPASWEITTSLSPGTDAANTALHPTPFEPFQLPDAVSGGLNHTGFMVIVGRDTLFPGNGVGLPLSTATRWGIEDHTRGRSG